MWGLNNSIGIAHKLGLPKPKVALLDFTEQHLAKVPSIEHSIAMVAESIRERQDCIVEGPMAYDIAISRPAAKAKEFESEVSGAPDILFCPDLESGQMLYDLYSNWEDLELPWKAADISFGGMGPVLVPSRSDSGDHKKRSIITALYIVHSLRIYEPGSLI